MVNGTMLLPTLRSINIKLVSFKINAKISFIKLQSPEKVADELLRCILATVPKLGLLSDNFFQKSFQRLANVLKEGQIQ